MSSCAPSTAIIGGVPAGSGGLPALSETTLFEVEDFAVGQPNGNVATGPINLTDVSRGITLGWEAQQAGMTSFAIGADGLRGVGDGATATNFNSASFTGNWLRLQLNTLYTNAAYASLNLDATLVYTIEAYFDLLTLNAGLPGVAVVGWGLAGSPSNAAARMQGVGRGLRAAAQTAFGKFDAGEGTNYTTGGHGDDNTLCATIASAGAAGAGMVAERVSVAAGWTPYRAVVSNYGRITGIVTSTMLDENAYLAVGMWSGNAAGAVYIFQLRSLRIRAWR
jgi:hypothetical protein